MAALAATNEPARQADHEEDNPDDKPHEGARDEGEELEVTARQRPRHGRRLQVGELNLTGREGKRKKVVLGKTIPGFSLIFPFLEPS